MRAVEYALRSMRRHTRGSCIIGRVPYSGEALKSPTTRLKSITVINVRFVPLECRLKCSYCMRQDTTVRACSLCRVMSMSMSIVRWFSRQKFERRGSVNWNLDSIRIYHEFMNYKIMNLLYCSILVNLPSLSHSALKCVFKKVNIFHNIIIFFITFFEIRLLLNIARVCNYI